MTIQRPRAVTAAAALLGLTLLVGLVQMIQFIAATDLGVPKAIPYSVLVAIYLAFVCLVFLISRGKDWARILYTVILALGLIKTAFAFPALLQSHSTGVAFFLMIGAKISALVLLFLPSSNAWFRGDGSNNSFKPKPLRGSA
ncbi:hypothetical protein J2X04_001623 [Lysobacter niabensis]|uniref:Uncharacterized protein n=1 Tax=Agrilutibacter niabensis TaxID=380628 RepID=A0ABU1VP62_9GAMM|nr:hypothetical protein [Lysobacter niabensis]MDR7099276.1 hypothetical protein [Lysobacter niabensis]